MPRAKTGKKTSVTGKVTEGAPKPKKRAAKPVVETPAHSQPDEVVVGRFYDVQAPTGRLFGELIGNGDEGQTLQVYQNGKPALIATIQFADQPVREISRETCFELSHTMMHEDKV